MRGVFSGLPASEQLLIERDVADRDARPAEGHGSFSAALSMTSAKRLVRLIERELLGNRSGGMHRNDQPVLPISQKLFGTASFRQDQRQARGQGLQRRVAHALVEGGKDEDVSLTVEIGKLLVGHQTQEVNPGIDVELSRKSAQLALM